MSIEMSDDARAYYAGGFKRIIGGVPCKVFARRLPDGRYVNAKDATAYDPLYDDPSHGISRLERDEEVIGQARLALDERQAPKPRKPRTPKIAQQATASEQEPVSATLVAPEPSVAPPSPVPAHSGDILVRLARLEALAGIVDAPKRTERHAAAIRRAWAMRQAMRERADLDRRALMETIAQRQAWFDRAKDAEARLRDMETARDEVVADMERVEAARAAAVRRAGLDEARAIDAETAVIVMTQERDEALALAAAEETAARSADRAATAMRREFHALEARADRLARIAVSHRRDVRHAREDVRRAQVDVVLLRKSERQAVKRLDEMRAAIDASPIVAKIIDRATSNERIAA